MNIALMNYYYRANNNFSGLVVTPSISSGSGVLLGSYTLSGGIEINRTPWVLDVIVSGTYTEGEVLTITCTWDKNSSGAVGVSTLGIYRHDNINTIAGSIGRTLVSTLTDGVDVATGSLITTTYTYTLVTGDIGKFLSFDFTAKVTGVTTTDSSILSSGLTDGIGANLPAIYVTVDPEQLLLKGDYNTGSSEWPNVGSDGGVWAGTGATKETGGEVTFASGGLSGTITASADQNFCVWAKFTWTSDSEIKTIFELSNNRQMEIMTGGTVRLKATTSQTTTGAISLSTVYNMICEHVTGGDFYIRVENNAGTLIFEETLTGTGANGIGSGVATIFQDLESTNQNAGVLHEFGVKYAVVSAGNKTSILTRLKSI